MPGTVEVCHPPTPHSGAHSRCSELEGPQRPSEQSSHWALRGRGQQRTGHVGAHQLLSSLPAGHGGGGQRQPGGRSALGRGRYPPCSNRARTPQLLLCPGWGLPASGQRLLQGHPRSALCGCWLWSPAPSQGRQTEVTPGTALSLRVTATRGEEGPSLLSPAPQTIHILQSPDPSRQQGPLRVLEGKLRHVRPQHEHAASD